MKTLLLTLAVTLLTISTGFAQTDPPADKDWEAFGLSTVPLELEKLRISLHVPLGAKLTKSPQSTRQLLIEPEDLTYVATVDVSKTANPDLDLDQVVDATLKQIASSANLTNQYGKSKLVIDNHPAYQIQVEVARPNGINEFRLYTIFSPQPRTFVTYTVWCATGHAQKVAKLYKASVESIRFIDVTEENAKRATALEASEKILSTITPEQYKKWLIPERWYRIYEPNSDGKDKEIGYYGVFETVAQRGKLTPTRRPNQYSKIEREQGIMVVLMARYVQPDKSVYEVENRAWAAFDRRSEVWSIRSAVYSRKEDGTYRSPVLSSLTGNMSGRRMETTINEPGQPVRESSIQIPPIAYITQIDRFLLYRVLKPWQAETYGTYYFDPTRVRIMYREDVIGSNEIGAGLFRSTQKLHMDDEPNNVTFDSDGRILKITSPGGIITEVSTLKEIKDHWEDAGLPTESMSKLVRNRNPNTPSVPSTRPGR